MPMFHGNSSINDRQRDAARAGVDLREERVAELMGRFDDVEANMAAIRAIGVDAFEPHAVFAPKTNIQD
jgi:hypothetical protein